MVIVDKNKQYWGALTKKNGEIQRIQIMSENPVQIYKVFKSKRKVTFLTNADTIYVEGIGNVGTTSELWEGEHIITFSKPEHRTEKVIIMVGEEDLTVEKYLIRTHGQLNINSSPSGANVYINNAMMGVTPLTLNSFVFGSYAVSLTKSGYYTSTFNVNFNTHPQTVSATLNPMPAPPVTPPNPPVIPDVPNPVDPPGCRNPGVQIGYPNKTSVSVSVSISSGSAKADFIELYLDGNYVTMLSGAGSYILYGLTPGRTYTVRAVAYCVNGQSAGASQTFTMPK